MEEKIKNKEIKLGAAKMENKQGAPIDKKYSYDELKDICAKLFQENNYMRGQLQQASDALRMFNRLDYLLKIVELANGNGSYGFSPSFVQDCIDEIEAGMTVPEQQEETKE